MNRSQLAIKMEETISPQKLAKEKLDMQELIRLEKIADGEEVPFSWE